MPSIQQANTETFFILWVLNLVISGMPSILSGVALTHSRGIEF